MTSDLTRRRFITTVAGASGLVAARVVVASPPTEGGLSHEGLLAGRPGFQPRSMMPLPHDELAGFLSREQLARHHDDYAREVDRLRSIEAVLRAGGVTDRDYRQWRRTQVQVANSVLLHELYFCGVAPQKVAPPRHIEGNMTEHMGSMESWRDDFTKCALAAKAWAALVYDPYDDRWHNAVMDSDDDGVWIGANPLVVCDVGEHAFARDYSRREDYVAKFLDHIDWEEVSKRYRNVDRM